MSSSLFPTNSGVKADRPRLLEPYIAIDIQPGAEFTWKNTFEYYILPKDK